MKIGIRTPSLNKRIAARTSPKRFIRQSLGIKMPRGYGWVTNPKKFAYNKVYNKTTIGLGGAGLLLAGAKATSHHAAVKKQQTSSMTAGQCLGCFAVFLFFIFLILCFTVPPIGILGVIGMIAIFAYYLSRPKQKANARLKAAVKKIQAGKDDEALALLKEAITLAPDNITVLYQLSLLLFQKEAYKEAIPYLEHLQELHPDFGTVDVLGQCYFKTQDIDKAISLFQSIPDSYQGYTTVLKFLGACFVQKSEYAMAIEVLKKAPLLKHVYDATLFEIAYLLAFTYETIGDKANALRYYRKIYVQDVSYKDVKEKIDTLESQSKRT